jgi:DNA processing protein
MDELTASLALARVPSLDARSVRKLVDDFGDCAKLASAPHAALRIRGVASSIIDSLRRALSEVEKDLRWLERPGHHFVAWHSPLYPPLLNELPDPPVALFVRGNPELLSLPQLAIVGSRNPTPGGRETAREFATRLARCGFVITSGLASGIDAASHAGALEAQGKTIAVCGTGLDTTYPQSNSELAERIAERGALVSEFPLGTPPLRANFPRRNRIISGLSLGTLVVDYGTARRRARSRGIRHSRFDP